MNNRIDELSSLIDQIEREMNYIKSLIDDARKKIREVEDEFNKHDNA